jgi:hypothetical protein
MSSAAIESDIVTVDLINFYNFVRKQVYHFNDEACTSQAMFLYVGMKFISINQSIDRSINQSINQSINHLLTFNLD